MENQIKVKDQTSTQNQIQTKDQESMLYEYKVDFTIKNGQDFQLRLHKIVKKYYGGYQHPEILVAFLNDINNEKKNIYINNAKGLNEAIIAYIRSQDSSFPGLLLAPKLRGECDLEEDVRNDEELSGNFNL
jgi:hypothetical protein